MAIHSFEVQLYHPSGGPVPGVDDGTMLQLEQWVRAQVRDSGRLPAGVTVVDPYAPGDDTQTQQPATPTTPTSPASPGGGGQSGTRPGGGKGNA